MNVRKALPGDVKGIAKVHVDSWRTTYKGIVPDEYLNNLSYESKEKIWLEGIKQKNVYVAEDGKGEIVGFSTGGKERSGSYPDYQGELYAIYILQAHQGKGIGRKLIAPIVDDLKKMSITMMLVLVLEENPSRLFYETLGAKLLDTIEVEIAGVTLKERVYGWDNLENV